MLTIVIAILTGILTYICIESYSKPKLQIKLASDNMYVDRNYPKNHPAKSARFLCLEVENKLPLRLTRWAISRKVAQKCHGEITFHHINGQDIFGRAMIIRWTKSPTPIELQDDIGKIIDIHTGEKYLLDVAAKFEDEDECYGWSTDNFFSVPEWRDPNWKLFRGRYLVKVTIESAGEKWIGIFRLINDVSQKDFRIENASKSEKKNIRVEKRTM